MYKRILIVHNCYLHKGGEDTVVNNEYNSLKNAGYGFVIFSIISIALWFGYGQKMI